MPGIISNITNCPIFDWHTHPLTLAVAKKAKELFEARFKNTKCKGFAPAFKYNIPSYDALAELMVRHQVSSAVVLPIATKPGDVPKVNRSVLASCAERPQFVPFGTLHPDGDYERDIEFLQKKEVKGVKLHSYRQNFNPLEPLKERKAFFQALEKSGLIVLPDCGDFLESTKYNGQTIPYEILTLFATTPLKILQILEWAPELRLTLPHMGGICSWPEVKQLKETKVKFDTSYAFHLALTRPKLVSSQELIRSIVELGPKRFIFGTDYPYTKIELEIAWLYGQLLAAGFEQKDVEDIFYNNAAELLELAA